MVKKNLRTLFRLLVESDFDNAKGKTLKLLAYDSPKPSV